jgi:hypothetical protein
MDKSQGDISDDALLDEERRECENERLAQSYMSGV